MKIFRLAAFLLTGLVCLVSSAKLAAQSPIQLQPFLSGLGSVLLVTNAKDGSNRLFIVEQGGIIKILQPNATTPTEFINISSKLIAGGERGLLGLAFHPQYASNRKFYVNYTCRTDNNPACVTTGDTIVSEFTTSASNPNQGDAASERVLLKVPQPFSNHNGGMIAFGPDGYLYIGMGDGGSGNDPQNLAQNRSRLLGKMVRIDVTPSGGNQYTIPPTNPFIGANTARCDNGSTTAGTCQEIFAIGLRNPFRWSFDRQTGQLFAGDVGQGVIEEIDIIQSGKNYGWRVYEGTQCTGLNAALCANGATPIVHEPPISQYNHTGGRCSITGGYVYHGSRGTFPKGTYIYGDYCTGEIWKLENTGSDWSSTLLLDTNLNVGSFGEDEAGEIYVCGISGGTVHKLFNPNPVAPTRRTAADFDGDLKTDISVFRPSNGYWFYLNSSNNNSFSGIQFGLSTDKLVPGDYDGDGKTDLGVFRDGVWFILNSSNNTVRSIQFGLSSDIPVPGDYESDAKNELAVYRPSNSTWYILNTVGTLYRTVQWGVPNGETPVPADFDGDGKTDIAVFRSSDNVWYVRQSQSNALMAVQWGAAGDIPVPGDYNNDGKADPAVWRSANGYWFALQSGDNTFYAKQWGINTDTPQPGDYDGDGKTDPAVTRNAAGSKTWYLWRSSDNSFLINQFGLTTDVGVPASDIQ